MREPLLRIKKSALGVALIDNGKWDACLIDAANLADGIYKTITIPVARNQTYFLMDDWGITWKQYLTDLLYLVGKVPTLSLPKSIVLPLAKLLDKKGVNTTRIAHGLPIGSSLDYADELTLLKSFEGRKKV